jgi:hypothetical protein
MYWNRSAADIASAWQSEIESKLETGATALLLAGAPSSFIGSAATVLGLQNSTLHRNDIANPWLVAGGNSALWLALLLAAQPTGSELNAPSPTLLYGGADEATYLALVGLTVSHVSQPNDAHAAIRPGTPLDMGIQFAPRLHPGAAAAWEMLPLVEVGEQPAANLPATNLPGSTQETAGGALSGVDSDPTGDWIVWGVMLFAFCLVLSALLI